VVLVLIGIAFVSGSRPRPTIDRPAPNAWLVGAGAFVAASLFFALIPNWLGIALGVLLIAVATAMIRRWSRRTGWGATHRFALAAR
jgi:hypothetical protein